MTSDSWLDVDLLENTDHNNLIRPAKPDTQKYV